MSDYIAILAVKIKKAQHKLIYALSMLLNIIHRFALCFMYLLFYLCQIFLLKGNVAILDNPRTFINEREAASLTILQRYSVRYSMHSIGNNSIESTQTPVSMLDSILHTGWPKKVSHYQIIEKNRTISY